MDAVLDAAPELTAARLARDTVAALPAGALLVLGSSTPVRDVDRLAVPRADVVVLANRGVAGIDGTISTAVGAALVHGGPTVTLMGDLTFLHDLTGLLIGQGEPAPDLTVVVPDNDGGGSSPSWNRGRTATRATIGGCSARHTAATWWPWRSRWGGPRPASPRPRSCALPCGRWVNGRPVVPAWSSSVPISGPRPGWPVSSAAPRRPRSTAFPDLRRSCGFLAGALRLDLQSLFCHRESPATEPTEEITDMSAKLSARGIVGSLRLVAVTAAVVAGLVAVGAAPASAAPSAEQGNVPVKACQNMDRAGVPLEVYLKHGCIVIPDSGEITGGSIF